MNIGKIDPLIEHLESQLELTIGEMKQRQELLNISKTHIKELKKMIKRRVKSELLAAQISEKNNENKKMPKMKCLKLRVNKTFIVMFFLIQLKPT